MADEVMDRILEVIRADLGDGIEAAWCEPSAPVSTAPRRMHFDAILTLLKLVPGCWLRLGPAVAGSYHTQARKAGVELTSRQEADGRRFMFLRYPKPAA